MTYSNITYIGAYSLIAFCSVITHTILPIPPTVIFFCLSSLLALWCVKRNEFKIKSINRVSIFPLLLSSYLLLFQLLLGVPFRALVSPFLAPLYFVVALFYLSILNKRNIKNEEEFKLVIEILSAITRRRIVASLKYKNSAEAREDFLKEIEYIKRGILK